MVFMMEEVKKAATDEDNLRTFCLDHLDSYGGDEM